MAFHIDIKPIKKMCSYQQAKDMFNNLTPIRGGDQSLRRIGNRSDETKWLKHEIREGVDVYVAGFHYTDLVTYYPTHYKLSMHGYYSMSTRLFIEAVLGVPVYNLNEKEYVPKGFKVDFDWNILFNYYPIKSHEVYDFNYDNTPITKLDHPIKYAVNRKRMNEVRKVAKPFYNYIDAMHNLLSHDVVGDRSLWNSVYRDANIVVGCLGAKEVFWDMFECLAWQTQKSRWDYQTSQRVYMRQPSAMKKVVDDALKAYNPQVLDRRSN
jgi:hypothetical protein